MWEPGEILRSYDGFTPLPAPADGGDPPSHARLTEYLTRLTGRALPLPASPLPLFFHLHVQVPRDINVIHGYVLEPFLTPLFGARWLNASRFVLAIGTKGTEVPSRLDIGVASSPSSTRKRPAGDRLKPSAAAGSDLWVDQLRRLLSRPGSVPLPEGPVHLRVQFRCSSTRNWVALWRPAGDAMGPILGYDHTRNPHHPRSDRVTRLEFHRQTDDRLGNMVEVEYMWTAVALEEA